MKKNHLVKIMLLVLALMVIPVVTQTTVNAQAGTAAEKALKGWVNRNGRNYYYLNNGKPIGRGWHKVNGVNCYFESNGRAAKGWLTYNGRRYFLTDWGRPVTGWQTIAGKRHCFDSSGRAYAGWITNGGKRYLLNSYGRVHYGWYTTGSYRYYFDTKYGYAYTGWTTIAGKRHYFRNTGRAYTGWVTYGGKRYLLNSYGRVHYGWYKSSSNQYYYFHTTNGYAYTGFQTIGGAKYGFASDGRALTGNRTINGVIYTFDSRGRVVATQNVNPVVYRMLAIGEADYPGNDSDLNACVYDARAMYNMARKTGYKNAKYTLNASKSKVKSEIRQAFSAADSNDVSVFYYTGHGSSDGSLVTVDYYGISPSELASWLRSVPGNVVVILDSCYSGAVIGKDSKAADPEAFNRNVIAAFENVTAKGGPMSNSKFRVLTACSQYQQSLATDKFSLFSYALVDGVGFDYNGTKYSYSGADTNRDKKVTFKECYNYTRQECYYYHSVQCYPTNSNLKLFQR